MLYGLVFSPMIPLRWIVRNKLFTILFSFSLLLAINGCAKSHVPLRVSCPPRPVMEEIRVKNGIVIKEDMPALVRNHIRLWEYLRRIEKLGCVAK